ncbi:MAG: DNA repair protein RadC [Planctomycetota bacterium]|jgi:DNA repair protein RadC|nr:DNA repair protein RadC [Planctomycetota bacterium]
MSNTQVKNSKLADWSNQELLNAFQVEPPSCFEPWRVAGMEPLELQQQLGCGSQASFQVAAAFELGRRAASANQQLGEPVRGGEDVYHYLAPRLAHLRCECFYVLYLDTKGRLVHEQEVSRGTLSSSLVHPREVFAPALLRRAAAIVVAHNHPSGDPDPSADDRTTTRRLQRAGRLLGIELLDHVVVGAGRFTSFLEQGWL